MSPPGTLEQVRRIADLETRIHAANAYIEAGTVDLRDARHLRDEDVRALAEQLGPAETARRTGLSLSTVKQIRGRP